MKTFLFVRSFSFILSVMLLSACSMLNTVSDDDVYVLSTPTLESGEELNDETSYQNYKYQKERQHRDISYGFAMHRGIMFVSGSPYSYRGSFPFYAGYYSVVDHAFYNAFYNNYYGYIAYPYPSYLDYPGSPCLANYPFGMGTYGYYNNPYYYGNTYSPKETGIHTTYFKARNAIGGSHVSRRQANKNQFGGMAGMAKPTNSRNNNVHTRNDKVSTVSRSKTTNLTHTARPVERGVGLSRPGTRVTSVSYNRNTSSAVKGPGREVKQNIGHSGSSPGRESKVNTSPSNLGNSTPTQVRRRN